MTRARVRPCPEIRKNFLAREKSTANQFDFVGQGVDVDVWRGYDLTVPYVVDIFGYGI